MLYKITFMLWESDIKRTQKESKRHSIFKKQKDQKLDSVQPGNIQQHE